MTHGPADIPGEHPPPPSVSDSFDPIGGLLRAGVLDPPDGPGVMARLDRYDILGLVGVGGMGAVLLARERGAAATVAIKTLKPVLVRDPYAVRLFLREARHMQGMDHPNILPVLDVSDRIAGSYFVLPFIERGSLAHLLRPGEPLDYDLTLSIAKQVAEALAYAHERGIIHRDVKPGNILVDGEGRAYVVDFGLVRAVVNDSVVSVTPSHFEGTVPYMSPAVAAGRAEDTRRDIYSLGCRHVRNAHRSAALRR